MRSILTALSIALPALGLTQSYQEGAFSFPDPAHPNTTLEAKLQVWSNPMRSVAKVGSHTILFVLDSISHPGFAIVDTQTNQEVIVDSDNTEPSMQQLHRWEGSLFPLLPTHVGFAGDWTEFQSVTESQSSASIFTNLSQAQADGGKVETLSYDWMLPEFAGRVTWGWIPAGRSSNMVSWSYVPNGGLGMRSARLGVGEIRTGAQALTYGSDAAQTPPNLSSFGLAQMGKIEMLKGSISSVSGFLQSGAEASKWLLTRTFYKMQSA